MAGEQRPGAAAMPMTPNNGHAGGRRAGRGLCKGTMLPFRFQTEAGTEPVVTVDGAFGAPGLQLSHWPGNSSPTALAHELSTGIALAFARLSEEERARHLEGCVAVVNNHYDTDGACALFALQRPDEALPRAERLLDVAATGDFFHLPSEAAFQIDVTLNALADPARSPIAEELQGCEDAVRYERAYAEALRILPALLDGELEPYASIWQGPLDDLRADRADLERAALDDLVHLDLAIWSATPGGTSSRASAPATFDPGRHVLFGSTGADRILVAGPCEAGTTYRFLVGTRSWFDLPEGASAPQPRPELAELCAQLNELEGTSQEEELAWRHQPQPTASPELWFGRSGLALFEEHAGDVLAPSKLDLETVKARLFDALRASWVFPDEDEEGDWMDV